MHTTVSNPPRTNNPSDHFVLAKYCQEMSPISIRLSELSRWFRHGGSQGIYVGSHLYPDGIRFLTGRSIPKETYLHPVPCFYNLRFECDGKGDNPLLDACKRMSAVCRVLGQLRHFQFLGAEGFEKHFTFFSTGRRSIYAVARSCSAQIAAHWDQATKAVMTSVNAVAGDGFVDLQIYNTPKAPGRAYFTQHEEGTFFNPIPFDAVVRNDVGYIKQLCAQSITHDWPTRLIETIGVMQPAGGPVYDALTQWIDIAQFQDEARKASFLPRLPNVGRPDYAALLTEHGHPIAKTKQMESTTYHVLKTCPYCGKGEHAHVSEFGKLKCLADSCAASAGISAAGDEGWFNKLGIEIDEDDIAEEVDAIDVDRYSDARDFSQSRDACEIRAELNQVISSGLQNLNGILVSHPPGLSKSYSTPSTVLTYLKAETKQRGRDCVAILAGPTRNQVSQWAQQARDQGVPGVFEVYGRSESNCSDHKRCVEVGSLGYEPMAVICSKCKHHPLRANHQNPACKYINALDSAAIAAGPRMIFCCYETIQTVFDKVVDKGGIVAVIVFDEDPSRYFSVTHTLILSAMTPSLSAPTLSESAHRLLWDRGRALFKILNILGDDIRGASKDPRVICGTLFRRLEQIASQQIPARDLSDLLHPDVEAAIEELIVATRKDAISSGVYKLKGSVVRPWFGSLISVLRKEYLKFRGGALIWNYQVMARIEDDNPVLRLTTTRCVPQVPKIVNLDATVNADRLRILMPGIPWEDTAPAVTMPEFKTIHLRCCATRRKTQSPDKDKLLEHVADVLKRFASQAWKILVVTYGSQGNHTWQDAVQSKLQSVMPSATVYAAHFGELRGSNQFQECDVVVTIGDNEPPPFGLLDEIAPFYADDPSPLSLEQEQHGGHRRYKDVRVRAWAERHTLEELAQVAHRHRPCINSGRTYIHVGNIYPSKFLGRPLVTVTPRQLDAEIAQTSILQFFSKHGWLCKPLLIAVGYCVDKELSSSQVVESFRRVYGAEFSLIPKPYCDRQLRNVMNEIVASHKRFVVRCPTELLIGGRICGWGDKVKFGADWKWILQCASYPEIVVDRAKVEGREGVCYVKSA